MFSAPDNELVTDEGQGFKAPDDEVLDQPKSKAGFLLDQVSNAVKASPLGMVASGANSLSQGINKALDVTGIPVPESIKTGAQALFRPFRAAGVGVMEQMTGQPSDYMTRRTVATLSPNYEPQGVIEKIGSTLGENAPVIAAGMVSPTLAGPAAMLAQQAQTGKVSPLPALIPAAQPLLRGAKFIGKKLFSSGTGVSEPAIDAYMKSPSSINEASPVSDLTQKLPQSLNTLQNQISEGDKAAWGTLSKSYTPPSMAYTAEDRAIPKTIVQGILDNAKKELSVYGGGLVGKAAKQAAAAINDISGDIEDVGQFSGGKIKSLVGVSSAIPKNQFLPETTVKGIIQSLDSNINWGDDTAQPLNTALENARVALDTILKKQNPGYAKAMEPVAEKMDLLKRVQKQFNIKSAPGEGFVPGTATENNLANVLNNNKSVIQGTLDELGKHTGDDYLTQLKNAKFAKEFQPGMRAQGSRRTLFGTALGSGVGHFTGSPAIGGMVGAATGFMMDTQGGPIAAKVLNAVSKIPGITPETIKAIQSALPAILSAQNVPNLSGDINNNQAQNYGDKQRPSSNIGVNIPKPILNIPVPKRSIFPNFVGEKDISGDTAVDAAEIPKKRSRIFKSK